MPVLAIFLTYDTITTMSIFRLVEKCKKQTNKQTNKQKIVMIGLLNCSNIRSSSLLLLYTNL